MFRITIRPYKSLEDYDKRFQLNYKRANPTLDPESLKLVLFRGIGEDVMEALNMLSEGDIYLLPYDEIKTIFRNPSSHGLAQFISLYINHQTWDRMYVGGFQDWNFAYLYPTYGYNSYKKELRGRRKRNSYIFS